MKEINRHEVIDSLRVVEDIPYRIGTLYYITYKNKSDD